MVLKGGGLTYGSIDGILSVLMMLRLYLVGKFIVVHSQLLTDPTTQTVAAVSHVKVNINFVFKVSTEVSSNFYWPSLQNSKDIVRVFLILRDVLIFYIFVVADIDPCVGSGERDEIQAKVKVT